MISTQPIETSSEEVAFPDSLATNIITVAIQLDSNAWKQVFANCDLFSDIRKDEKILIHSFRPVLKFKEPSNGIPLFIDGSLDPRVFFGINSEFSNVKAQPMKNEMFILHVLSIFHVLLCNLIHPISN